MRLSNGLALGSLCVLASACSNDGGVAKTPNEPPVAEAGDNRTVGTDIEVAFDGSASTDPDGTIATYTWDFGDGTPTSTGAQVDHTFTSDGVYTVTLTIEDDGGATDQDSPTVTSEVLVVDGTYALQADPTQQPCNGGLFAGSMVTWVTTQIVVNATNGGSTLVSNWGTPPGEVSPEIGDGPLVGAQFVNDWLYQSVQDDPLDGAFGCTTMDTAGNYVIVTTYVNNWQGSFAGDGTFTSELVQNITDDCDYLICTGAAALHWQVDGTKIQ